MVKLLVDVGAKMRRTMYRYIPKAYRKKTATLRFQDVILVDVYSTVVNLNEEIFKVILKQFIISVLMQ